MIKPLLSIANDLDSASLTREATILDDLIKKAFFKKTASTENYDRKSLLGLVKGIIGSAKKLDMAGSLEEAPPGWPDEASTEDALLEEGAQHGPQHLRRWFGLMQGKKVRGQDFNRKKQIVLNINEDILTNGLEEYGMSALSDNLDDIDEMTMDEISKIRGEVLDLSIKVKSLSPSKLIYVPVDPNYIYEVLDGKAPPEGYSFLKNESFHVTIISPQTMSNVSEILREDDFEELMQNIQGFASSNSPDVKLGSTIGHALRSKNDGREVKASYVLPVENQEELSEYRDSVVLIISDFIKDKNPRENPNNWWFKRHENDSYRYFHVSIANRDEGWPTYSVADVREEEIFNTHPLSQSWE